MRVLAVVDGYARECMKRRVTLHARMHRLEWALRIELYSERTDPETQSCQYRRKSRANYGLIEVVAGSAAMRNFPISPIGPSCWISQGFHGVDLPFG